MNRPDGTSGAHLEVARARFDRRAMPRPRIPFTAEGLEIVAKSVEVIGQVVGQEIHEAIAPLVAQVKALEKRVADLKCQGCL